MEFLKQWTLCVCISLIIAVIFSLFTPKGRMNGFYRILISFFVFFSFLYPLKNAKGIDFESLLPEFSLSESEAQIENPYRELVKKQVEDTLKKHGITGASVMPEVKTDLETGEITLESLKIAVPDGYDKNRVRDTVFDSLGIYAEVTGIGD